MNESDRRYTPDAHNSPGNRAPVGSAAITYGCPHCGREISGAGPAARHRSACGFGPVHGATQYSSVELFAGAGGLALGLAQAGFKHLAVVERAREACASLRHNGSLVPEMQGWPIFETDSRNLDFSQWAGRVSVLSAGAPCQPFSQGGKRRGEEDERNMFPEVLRAVREIRPEVVIIENVKGLLRKTAADYFAYILEQLRTPEVAPRPDESWLAHRDRLNARIDSTATATDELRYEVAHQLLNAADFGLAQHRERVFIVGFRSDLLVRWEPLRPTHSRDALLYSQWVSGSYWTQHSILPQFGPPERMKRRIEQMSLFDIPREERWRTVRDALSGLPDPLDGIQLESIANHAGIPGARSYQGHTGSPLDYPAKTLKAGAHGVPGGENMLRRPDGTVRYFTVREMARLQGFPDKYEVQGAWTNGMRQLGNAVPVALARVVAARVRKLLDESNAVAQVA